MQDGRHGRIRGVGDWLFRDRRTGSIVVAQLPNVPILLFLATIVARLFVEAGTTVEALLAWAGTATLAWWALDELVRGVNPFRRLLGVAGCLAVVVMVAGRL